MRLSEIEREVIVRVARQHFGDGSRVRLFGSRLDDSRRGGDIDLFIDIDPQLLSDVSDREMELLRLRAAFLAALKAEIGEQKIDLVLSTSPERPIEREARRTGATL